jgi:hypothetical protein
MSDGADSKKVFTILNFFFLLQFQGGNASSKNIEKNYKNSKWEQRRRKQSSFVEPEIPNALNFLLAVNDW